MTSVGGFWAGAIGWAQRLLDADGEALRTWLIERTPDVLHPILGSAPLWVLAGTALLVGFGSLWATVSFVAAGVQGVRFAGKAVTRPGDAVADVFTSQPSQRQVKEISDEVQLLGLQVSAQSEMLATVKAQLDRMQAQRVAAGASTLSADERARRDEALGDVVTDATPSAQEALQDIVAGDLDSAIAALKRNARSDTQAAAEKWRRVGALARGVNDAEALAAYQQAFALQPGDFWTCIALGRLHIELDGDVVAARAAAEGALEAAQSEREKGVAYSDLGNILLASDDALGARAHYERFNAIAEALAAKNPDNVVAQRDLAVSLNKLANLMVKIEDYRRAKDLYESSLTVTSRLAAQNPGNQEFQRDLFVSYGALGDLAYDADDMSRAADLYETSRAIAEKLAAQSPDNGRAQRDLSISYGRLGDVAATYRAWDHAVSNYEMGAEFAERLARRNPDSVEAKRDLSVIYHKLSDVMDLSGRSDEKEVWRSKATALGVPREERKPWRVAMDRSAARGA